jgi:hypothetical protein
MAFCWFLVGAIGQRLPHWKSQSFSELARDATAEWNDRLTQPESLAVAKVSLHVDWSARARKPRKPAHSTARAIVDLVLCKNENRSAQDYLHLIAGLSQEPGLSRAEFALETMIYILHCLDVCVLKQCGNEYRTIFMDSAAGSLCDAFFESLDWVSKDNYKNWFAYVYQSRQIQYSQYKFPLANGPLEGTLFWEYGKYICSRIGAGSPAKITRTAVQATEWFGMAADLSRSL